MSGATATQSLGPVSLAPGYSAWNARSYLLAAMITVYGPKSRAEAMIAGVGRMHARVEGVTPAGVAYRADDLFGRLVATGIVAWLAFQMFENIGMSLGIMPITGIPLPLVSAGGTSMMATWIAIGLLQNVRLHAVRAGV